MHVEHVVFRLGSLTRGDGAVLLILVNGFCAQKAIVSRETIVCREEWFRKVQRFCDGFLKGNYV